MAGYALSTKWLCVTITYCADNHQLSFENLLAGIPKVRPSVWIKIRRNKASGLIWFQLFQWRSQNAKNKQYAHQRETTGSGSDSLNWVELLLKERICSPLPQGANPFLRADPFGMENNFCHIRLPP